MAVYKSLIFYREKHRMTQRDLARIVGVCRTNVTKWEAGEDDLPPSKYIVPICKALKITPNQLFNWE